MNLIKLSEELVLARKSEVLHRLEVEAWAPASIVRAISSGNLSVPGRRNLMGITFDIINSSALNAVMYGDIPLRNQVICLFEEILLTNGGIKETESGDSAYGHFNAVSGLDAPAEATMATAHEFLSALQSLIADSGVPIAVGIALHYIPDAFIHVREAKSKSGEITHKSLVTQSPHIDLLHRMESLLHRLESSNIIMSRAFLDQLQNPPQNLLPLGRIELKGGREPIELFLHSPNEISSEQHQRIIERLKNPRKTA